MSTPATLTDSDIAAKPHRRVGDTIARYAAPIGLLALAILFSFTTPYFLTAGNLTAVLVSAAVLIVMSMGQQLVITAAGIDLSVGSNLPFVAVIIGWTYLHGWGIGLAIVAGILAGLAVGILNGLLIGYLKMADFVATLGTLSVVSGATLLITGGNQLSVSSDFMQDLALGGVGPIRWFWLVAAVITALTGFLVFCTRTGTYLLSTGGNIDAARDVGIKVKRIQMLAYAGSGLACGIAGVLFVANIGGADPSMQTNLLLSSIAAVVLGGTSLSGGRASILGTLAGALLFQVLLNGFTLLNISQYFQPVAVGAVVLGAAFISRFQR